MLYRDVCGSYLSLHVGALNEEQYQYAVMEIISELVNKVGFTKEEAHKFVTESLDEISATYLARERFARVIRKIAEIDA